jgi:hypothetical protein
MSDHVFDAEQSAGRASTVKTAFANINSVLLVCIVYLLKTV